MMLHYYRSFPNRLTHHAVSKSLSAEKANDLKEMYKFISNVDITYYETILPKYRQPV